MTTKRMTRQRYQLHRANTRNLTSNNIIAEYERGTLLAGLLVAVAFGICFFVGMVF